MTKEQKSGRPHKKTYETQTASARNYRSHTEWYARQNLDNKRALYNGSCIMRPQLTYNIGNIRTKKSQTYE